MDNEAEMYLGGLKEGRQEVIDTWLKCLEDSKSCGLCGAPNAFRAMLAFNEALGLDNRGNMIGANQ